MADSYMPYSSSLYQSQWAPGRNAATLNPAGPSFEPRGRGLERYQPRTTREPISNEMQKLLVDTTYYGLRNVARIDHEGRRTATMVEELREAVRKDLQTLEHQIKDIASTKAEVELKSLNYKTYPSSPPTDGTSKQPRELLAEKYEEEAKTMAYSAAELRKHAAIIMRPEIKNTGMTFLHTKPPRSHEEERRNAKKDAKLVENRIHIAAQQLDHEDVVETDVRLSNASARIRVTPIAHPGSSNAVVETKAAIFACCKLEYPSLDGLRAHVASTHSNTIPASVSTKVGTERATQDNVESDESTASRQVENRTPYAIGNFKPFLDTTFKDHNETFSRDLLAETFQGEEWCSGYYFEPQSSCSPSKSYWILDADNDPYLPSAPGQHGAKLTAFLNDSPVAAGVSSPDDEHYSNVPVFIREAGSGEYRYYGNYNQGRRPDKVDYDHLTTTIPERVKQHWAAQLSASDRPAWVTQKLMEHFWLRPQLCGPIPEALKAYAEELKEWKKDARFKVSRLTEETICDAFSKADTDSEPGLRLWWEYFECVKYDAELYDFLVKLKAKPAPAVEVAICTIEPDVGTEIKSSIRGRSHADCDSQAGRQEKATATIPARIKEAERTAKKANLSVTPSYACPADSDVSMEPSKHRPGGEKAAEGGKQDKKNGQDGSGYSKADERLKREVANRPRVKGLATVPPHLRHR